ncbi:hypothetical protein [Halostagnicola sp. A56]|uniref:hypothetical protein n=1 Tax=Halostagnicola sp. A56 TaxID=1495067 RepID=UPI0012E10FDB|nr:hypothetical protein [Halostagnicola sp. A56]
MAFAMISSLVVGVGVSGVAAQNDSIEEVEEDGVVTIDYADGEQPDISLSEGDDDYFVINIGIVFFITSIGFALLGSSNHVVAHGIQAQNVKEIRENNGLTKTELKKMLLISLDNNIRFNSKVSIRKKVSCHFISTVSTFCSNSGYSRNIELNSTH